MCDQVSYRLYPGGFNAAAPLSPPAGKRTYPHDIAAAHILYLHNILLGIYPILIQPRQQNYLVEMRIVRKNGIANPKIATFGPDCKSARTENLSS